MPRRKHLRKIVEPPRFKSFKPEGIQKEIQGSVDLLYEEYEALKLADYDGLHHHQACEMMGVSRPTFARIYESARRKIAKAFVELKEITAVYGNVEFDHHWYRCNKCHAIFTLQRIDKKYTCPVCSAENVESIIK